MQILPRFEKGFKIQLRNNCFNKLKKNDKQNSFKTRFMLVNLVGAWVATETHDNKFISLFFSRKTILFPLRAPER